MTKSIPAQFRKTDQPASYDQAHETVYIIADGRGNTLAIGKDYDASVIRLPLPACSGFIARRALVALMRDFDSATIVTLGEWTHKQTVRANYDNKNAYEVYGVLRVDIVEAHPLLTIVGAYSDRAKWRMTVKLWSVQ